MRAQAQEECDTLKVAQLIRITRCIFKSLDFKWAVLLMIPNTFTTLGVPCGPTGLPPHHKAMVHI